MKSRIIVVWIVSVPKTNFVIQMLMSSYDFLATISEDTGKFVNLLLQEYDMNRAIVGLSDHTNCVYIYALVALMHFRRDENVMVMPDFDSVHNINGLYMSFNKEAGVYLR